MSNILEYSDIIKCKEAFKKFDLDDDGRITEKELGILFSEMGRKPSKDVLH